MEPFWTTFGVLRGAMVAIKSTPEEKICFWLDFKPFLTSFLTLKWMKILIKIPSKFGVEKCKIRTVADGPHDKHEMPACAFRLVNT